MLDILIDTANHALAEFSWYITSGTVESNMVMALLLAVFFGVFLAWTWDLMKKPIAPTECYCGIVLSKERGETALDYRIRKSNHWKVCK